MDGDLVALLRTNGVPDKVIEALGAAKCHKLSLFANGFDQPSEIKDFVNTVQAHKDDLAVKAVLKVSWLKAVEMNQRAVESAAQGLEDEHLDDPLPAEQYRDSSTTALLCTVGTGGCQNNCRRPQIARCVENLSISSRACFLFRKRGP